MAFGKDKDENDILKRKVGSLCVSFDRQRGEEKEEDENNERTNGLLEYSSYVFVRIYFLERDEIWKEA